MHGILSNGEQMIPQITIPQQIGIPVRKKVIQNHAASVCNLLSRGITRGAK